MALPCPGCSRKYTHGRPLDGAGVPDLVPMVDLYERVNVDVKTGELTGPSPSPPPVPRLRARRQAAASFVGQRFPEARAAVTGL